MDSTNLVLIQSGTDYFDKLVQTGLESRGLSVSHPVVQYLANILIHYVDARNLHDPEYDESGKKNPQTLAEMWLTAQNAEPLTQRELLKKLGDRTLYISGFFSESLNRSLVDLDYYSSMGTSAYRTLSISENKCSSLYNEMSIRFHDLVSVLNFISHETFIKTDQGILKLYETYLRTGSSLAKEKLQALGVFAAASSNATKKHSGH